MIDDSDYERESSLLRSTLDFARPGQRPLLHRSDTERDRIRAAALPCPLFPLPSFGSTTMHSPATSLFHPPYGLSFPIEELVQVRRWAEERQLRMIVALDQTAENAEFEEMLILAPLDRSKRTLTIWRTLGAIFLQIPNGRPRAFATIDEALASLRPAPAKRNKLLRFLGLPR
jgi:hypothetical protein